MAYTPRFSIPIGGVRVERSHEADRLHASKRWRSGEEAGEGLWPAAARLLLQLAREIDRPPPLWDGASTRAEHGALLQDSTRYCSRSPESF